MKGGLSVSCVDIMIVSVRTFEVEIEREASGKD